MAAGLVSASPAGEPITRDLGGAPIMEVNLRVQKISAAIRTLEDRIADMLKGVNDGGHRVLTCPVNTCSRQSEELTGLSGYLGNHISRYNTLPSLP